MLRIKENITWYSVRDSFISKMVDIGPLCRGENGRKQPLTIYKHYYKNTKRNEIKKQMVMVGTDISGESVERNSTVPTYLDTG